MTHKDPQIIHHFINLLLILVALGGILMLDDILTGMIVGDPTQSLLDPDSPGFDSQTRAENYAELMNQLYSSGNVTQSVDGKLWVPWYSSSTSCTIDNLHSGGNCNVGGTIDMDRNCMVTDELSQVGIMISLGDNQTRMDEYFETLKVIESNFGQLPAWRIFRDGSTIEPCKDGVNGNCDTASDASARIIISLFTASNNTEFNDEEAKQQYWELGKNLTEDFVEYEILDQCYASDLGYGDICHWLAAGSQVRNGGMASTDFGYTGYYPDAIIALVQACGQLQNGTYCTIAKNLTLNYLQAAQWDGSTFTAPPGRSWKWTNLDGVPQASCTNTCSPVMWDSADAPRAIGLCQALYYGEIVNVSLPGLRQYCDQWGDAHMTNPQSAPIQYEPDGTPSAPQSSFFAQGLQSLFHAGYDPTLFDDSLDDALDHYAPSQGTWDWTSCFGVYHQALPVRGLGFGMGRDLASFATYAPAQNESGEESNDSQNESLDNISITAEYPATDASIAEPGSQDFNITINNTSGQDLTITWSLDGTQTVTGETAYTYTSNYESAGTYIVAVRIESSTNNVSTNWTLQVNDTIRDLSIANTQPSAGALETNSSTNLSVTLNNPDEQPVTHNWSVNGTDQGVNQTRYLFNKSSYGLYNVTYNAYSVNNLSTYWIINHSNASINISEANISQNESNSSENESENLTDISFTTSPASSVNLEPDETVTLSYNLTNPDNLSTNTTWAVDGTTQGTKGNVYGFSRSTEGTFNVTVTLNSSQNNLTNTWTITVQEPQEQESSSSSSSGGGSRGGGGGGGGGGYFAPSNEETEEDPEEEVRQEVRRFFERQEEESDPITLIERIRALFEGGTS